MSFAAHDVDDLTVPFTCPECGDTGTRQRFASSDYSCPGCNLSVAHVDVAPTGLVRQVFGWLLSPGALLAGRYQVNTLLGRGGFAATYGVADTRLANRRCALKEVPRVMFDSGEMEILSRLDHPGIPSIRDKFELGSMVYLVLEFGGRRSLAMERVERGGKIPPATVLPWISQLCGVLEYLHSQDPPIVHRDLKPGNVLLTEDGRINLIDFGIAKESDVGTQTRTIARSATHGFSPPEQVLGTGTDQRSDVYALGATLYQLLTGEKPPPAHERVAGAELLRPSSLVDGMPAPLGKALDELILRAMELNINRRVQSIGEFAKRLDAIAGGTPMPLAPADGPTSAVDDALTLGAERRMPTSLSEGETLVLGDQALGSTRPRQARRLWPAIAALLVIGIAGVGGAMWWMQRGSVEQIAAPENLAAVPATETPAFGTPIDVTPTEPGVAKPVEPVDAAELLVAEAAPSEPSPAAAQRETDAAPAIAAVPAKLEPPRRSPPPAEAAKPRTEAVAAGSATPATRPPERSIASRPTGAAGGEEVESETAAPVPTKPDWGAGFKKGSVRRTD